MQLCLNENPCQIGSVLGPTLLVVSGISSNETPSFCYGEGKLGKEIPRLWAFDEYIHNHVAKIISFLFFGLMALSSLFSSSY